VKKTSRLVAADGPGQEGSSTGPGRGSVPPLDMSDTATVSVSTIQGYKRALLYLHRRRGLQFTCPEPDEAPQPQPQPQPQPNIAETWSPTEISGTSHSNSTRSVGRQSSENSPNKGKLLRNANQKLDAFIGSYTKIVADKKSRGVMQVQEGKSGIAFSEYKLLNNLMRTTRPRTGSPEAGNTWIFGWAATTLMWNLVCRFENCMATCPALRFH